MGWRAQGTYDRMREAERRLLSWWRQPDNLFGRDNLFGLAMFAAALAFLIYLLVTPGIRD
jgi:hypothetical protein